MSIFTKNRERKLTFLPTLNYVKTSGIFPGVCFLFALLVNTLLVFVVPVERWIRELNMVGLLVSAGQYIPSIRKIGELSEYPILFQFVFLFEIMLIPMMVVLFIKYGNFKLERALEERMLAALVILVGLIVAPIYVLFYMPGDPEGVAYPAKIARSILYSKIGFTWWTTLILFSMTLFFAGSLALIHKWVTR